MWVWVGIYLVGICEVGCGFRFPSISLHKKIVTAPGGGGESFTHRPSVTHTFSESILSN